MPQLKAPFPYFGGKSRIGPLRACRAAFTLPNERFTMSDDPQDAMPDSLGGLLAQADRSHASYLSSVLRELKATRLELVAARERIESLECQLAARREASRPANDVS